MEHGDVCKVAEDSVYQSGQNYVLDNYIVPLFDEMKDKVCLKKITLKNNLMQVGWVQITRSNQPLYNLHSCPEQHRRHLIFRLSHNREGI